jgi:putative transposase
MAANQLWVADITYIVIANGDVCYLHLITDAYSHKIIGWVLADTLRAAITKEALEQAISQAGHILPDILIHHSDRGAQYCCDDYVETLRRHHIRISMTEDSNPTDNAIAERTNGIIKGEGIYPRETFNSLEHARYVIGRYIHFYNNRRPHMSIGYKVPALAHMESGPQKKMWKGKIYKKKECTNGNNEIPLPCQTKSPDDSLSHQHGI